MSDSIADMLSKVHSNIPISRQMEFAIITLDTESINTRAPLEPNINIHGTGFAGSLYSLAILTAWSYASYLIDQNGLNAELVIGSGKIRYKSPIESDIECDCHALKKDIDLFIDTLVAGRRAKLNLEVSVNKDKAVVQALMVATPEGR